MTTLNEYCKLAYENAKQKGFYDDNPNPDPLSKLMLVVSELGEACEAIRKNNIAKHKSDLDVTFRRLESTINDVEFKAIFGLYIKDTFEDELADTVIRIFDICGSMDINLKSHIETKMRYNRTRPYKHDKTC